MFFKASWRAREAFKNLSFVSVRSRIYETLRPASDGTSASGRIGGGRNIVPRLALALAGAFAFEQLSY